MKARIFSRQSQRQRGSPLRWVWLLLLLLGCGTMAGCRTTHVHLFPGPQVQPEVIAQAIDRDRDPAYVLYSRDHGAIIAFAWGGDVTFSAFPYQLRSSLPPEHPLEGPWSEPAYLPPLGETLPVPAQPTPSR